MAQGKSLQPWPAVVCLEQLLLVFVVSSCHLYEWLVVKSTHLCRMTFCIKRTYRAHNYRTPCMEDLYYPFPNFPLLGGLDKGSPNHTTGLQKPARGKLKWQSAPTFSPCFPHGFPFWNLHTWRSFQWKPQMSIGQPLIWGNPVTEKKHETIPIPEACNLLAFRFRFSHGLVLRLLARFQGVYGRPAPEAEGHQRGGRTRTLGKRTAWCPAALAPATRDLGEKRGWRVVFCFFFRTPRFVFFFLLFFLNRAKGNSPTWAYPRIRGTWGYMGYTGCIPQKPSLYEV